MKSSISSNLYERAGVYEPADLAPPILLFLLCAAPVAGLCALTGLMEADTFIGVVLTITVLSVTGGLLWSAIQRAGVARNSLETASRPSAVHLSSRVSDIDVGWRDRSNQSAQQQTFSGNGRDSLDYAQYIMNKSSLTLGTIHLFNPLLP